MTRNYFSKKGGPYFINDGFTHHNDKDDQSKSFTNPRKLIARITKGRKKSQGIPEELFEQLSFFEE